MGITKQVLNWVDKKYEAVQNGDDTKHPYLKAFGLGAIEGAIDGAVLAYPILVVGLFIAGRELNKLKNE